MPEQTEILVCIKCKRGTEVTEEGERPGAHLFETLKARALPQGVAVRAVECLQNCDYGCSVALRGGAQKWTYVYGNLHEVSHLDTLIEGAGLYHQTADGLIPWRTRPEHFKRNCIARIPPQEDTPND
ncbi:DUF1636 family protein [Roseobacter weihaiensis]|uniref:DUF1636 family protein n=1 Tax=Roseobacter weihaiensis TaxID=2763262 RepID=UPI001D0A2104|nr:DUF1636 domain-containing protein [Roseobacter sp. H9]